MVPKKKTKQKTLGINQTKEVNDIHGENYRSLIKEIKEKWKEYYIFLDWKN